jgi:uncharacterized protein YceK
MLKTFRICVVILLFCSGCDTAAKQQQAEQARAAAAAANLKQIGEDMHNKRSDELPVDGGSKN